MCLLLLARDHLGGGVSRATRPYARSLDARPLGDLPADATPYFSAWPSANNELEACSDVLTTMVWGGTVVIEIVLRGIGSSRPCRPSPSPYWWCSPIPVIPAHPPGVGIMFIHLPVASSQYVLTAASTVDRTRPPTGPQLQAPEGLISASGHAPESGAVARRPHVIALCLPNMAEARQGRNRDLRRRVLAGVWCGSNGRGAG